MENLKKQEPQRRPAHAELRRMVEEINSTIGISREPIATPEKVRDMLQADTIHRQDYEIRRNIGRHGRGEED